MIGMTSAAERALAKQAARCSTGAAPHSGIHKRFATANGEAAMTGLKALLKLHHDRTPGTTVAGDRCRKPTQERLVEERNLLPLLDRVKVPVYLGCDWQNVPLHLPSRSARSRLGEQRARAYRHAR